MNKNILKTGVQSFIIKNLSTDTMSVLLKKPIFEGVSQKELVQQLESKKKCQKKLPTWFNTLEIYYPKKIHIEQTSSEITAQYKAEIIAGKSLIDLTGGFGVDSYFFSQKIASVFHCEIDENLSKIAAHNYKKIGTKNIEIINEDGVAFLEKTTHNFDCIYVDPSRRHNVKGKVFLLSDCLPNIPKHLPLLFEKTDTILIKTSPLLDLSSGINELQFVKEIHIVAITNEVKELLWVLKKEYVGEVCIKTINHKKSYQEKFNFELSEEKVAVSEYSKPLSYLYEPNAAILKSGAFKLIGNQYNLKKIHEHTHLYTSTELLEFPGRSFKIEETLYYTNKLGKSLKGIKANVSTKNFPLNVATLRKKMNLLDGGETYLFFTKNAEEELIMMKCKKVTM